jgi:hypothetical protein
MLKERSIYREQKVGKVIAFSKSNAYNLSYLMGRVECGGCTGSIMSGRVLGS